jgi:hypothetical protein
LNAISGIVPTYTWADIDKTISSIADITTRSHTLLTDIGTNTHAQIDSHITTTGIHFTYGTIDHNTIQNHGSNTHTQIDSHILTTGIHWTYDQIEHQTIQGHGVYDHSAIDSHITTTGTHFTYDTIDHETIIGHGTNTHAVIDSHLATTGIHFTYDTIDHETIVGHGANTHSQIDSHIATTGIHFTYDTIDHGTIQGLADDDHLQYALLAGRTGGQTLTGGTAAGEDLTLRSTAHVTKGNIFFGNSTYDEVNNRMGINIAAPAVSLQVSGIIRVSSPDPAAFPNVSFSNDASQTGYIAALGSGTGGTNPSDWRFVQTKNDTGYYSFYTTTSTVATERVRIINDGRIYLEGSGTLPSSPSAQVTIVTNASSPHPTPSQSLGLVHSSDDLNGPQQVFRKTRGTIDTPTIIANGDTVGILAFQGYDGSTYANAALIKAYIDGTPGAGDMPGRLSFFTTPDGSSTALERFHINPAGRAFFTPAGSFNATLGSANLAVYTDTTTGNSSLIQNHFSTDVNGTYIGLRKYRGTISSPSIVSLGDQIANISFAAYDGTAVREGAAIHVVVDGTPGASDMPARMAFLTTPDGSSTPVERLRIDNVGATRFAYSTTTTPGAFPGSNTWYSEAGTPLGVFQTAGASPGTGTQILLRKSRGTNAAPSLGLTGDQVGALYFDTWRTGTTFGTAGLIEVLLDGTQTSGSLPGALVLHTTPVGSTSPTERVRILSDGRVGIGTSIPSNTLSVNGTVSGISSIWTTGAVVGFSGSPAADEIQLGDANFKMQWTSANVVGLQWDTSDTLSYDRPTNVLSWTFGGTVATQMTVDSIFKTTNTSTEQRGITSAQGSADIRGAKLFLRKHRNTATVQNGDEVGALQWDPYDGTSYVTSGTAAIKGVVSGAVSSLNIPTDILFMTGPSGPIERMRVTSGGNVGIGPFLPTEMLSIRQDTNAAIYHNITNNSTGTSAVAGMYGTTGAGGWQILMLGANHNFTSLGTVQAGRAIFSTGSGQTAGLWIGTENASAPLVFATGASQRMRITGAGLVGIGTASPTNELTVNGTVSGIAALFTSITSHASGGPANSERFGLSASATGTNSLSVGASASATATNATAVGQGASAAGAGGNGSAFGFGSVATGTSSTALGSSTSATGTGSIAVGINSTAAFANSIAIGNTASATGAGDGQWGSLANPVNFRSYGIVSGVQGIFSFITTSGTVDGRDISVDGATLDSHITTTGIHFSYSTIDHGTIQGLGDDDHLQYHNDTRGDIRYFTKAQVITISGFLQSEIDTKSDIGHIHDDRYYTESEINTISGFLQSELDSHTSTTGIHFTYDTIDHGTITGLTDDDHLQYLTSGRADTWLSGKTTTNLTEGSNLYFTDERVDDRVASLLVAGSGIELLYSDVGNSLTISVTGITGGGVTDHGALTGLGNDDHTQYLLANGTRVATSLTVTNTVTASGISASGINVGYIGTPPFGALSIGDANYFLSLPTATTPRITFDSSDYIEYDRTNNRHRFFLGGLEKLRISSNGALSVNNTNSNYQFIVYNDALNGVALLAGLGSDGASEQIFYRGNGTISSMTDAANNNQLGAVIFSGNISGGITKGAKIAGWADGAPGTGNMPGRLTFHTSGPGTQNLTERMRITSTGDVRVQSKLSTLSGIDLTFARNTTDIAKITATGLWPASSGIYDLGSPAFPWRDLYVTSGTVHIDGVDISANGTTAVFGGGITVGGIIDLGGYSITNAGPVDGTDVTQLATDFATHSGDQTIHFTQAQIDHGTIAGLNDDDHGQYLTSGRADNWLTTKTTTNLTEGSNLYYTDERVDDRVAGLLVAGSGIELLYNDGANTLTVNVTGITGGGVSDHGALTGLADDDHTQYALLAGRSGGQILYGSTVAGENLTLSSTSDSTKGKIYLGTSGVWDDALSRLGLGTLTPTERVHVAGANIAINNGLLAISGVQNTADAWYAVASTNPSAQFKFSSSFQGNSDVWRLRLGSTPSPGAFAIGWFDTAPNITLKNGQLTGIGTNVPANTLDVGGAVVIGSTAGYAGTTSVQANGLIVEGRIHAGVASSSSYRLYANAPNTDNAVAVLSHAGASATANWIIHASSALSSGYTTGFSEDNTASYMYINTTSRGIGFNTGAGAFPSTGTTRLFIGGTGLVGVGNGTTAPTNLFGVNGAATIGATYYSTGAPANGLLVAGSVGIGTATVTNTLQVNGSGSFGNGLVVGFTSAATADEIQLGDANFKMDYTSTTQVGLVFDANDYINYNRTSNIMDFLVGAAKKFEIATTVVSGFVPLSIDSTATAYPIEALCDASGFSAYFRNGTTNNVNRQGLRIQCGETSSAGTQYPIRAYSNDGTEIGGLWNNAGTFAVYDISDQNRKTDITQTSVDALDIIKNLGVYSYKYTDGETKGKKHSAGFIAQELQALYPDAVHVTPDGNYATNRTALIPVLVKALQEQQKTIEDLLARIEALENP